MSVRPPGGGFRTEGGGSARGPPPAFPRTVEPVCVRAGGEEEEEEESAGWRSPGCSLRGPSRTSCASAARP